jgi:transcriptional regulator with XRE-family HTH domain
MTRVDWSIDMMSEALRLLRVFHDLKQFELAEKLSISKAHISEIESGLKTPSFDLIEKYSAFFKIPVSAIVFFAEELPNAKTGEKIRTKMAGKVIDFLQFVENKANAEHAN